MRTTLMSLTCWLSIVFFATSMALHYVLHLQPSPPSIMIVYIDADWARCSDTHRSTFDYVVFLNTNLIYWLSKRQNTATQSNVEVDYQGMANGVAWLRKLHRLHCIILSSSVTISSDGCIFSGDVLAVDSIIRRKPKTKVPNAALSIKYTEACSYSFT